jgi:CRP/FNR family transcriptional regulator, cyclic AMP receptor protein
MNIFNQPAVRRYELSGSDLSSIAWLNTLEAHLRDYAFKSLQCVEVPTNHPICRMGEKPTHWLGTVRGLLKMSSNNAVGATVTLCGLAPGGWFGEGTLLKGEAFRYDVHTLRPSVVAGLPVVAFERLLNDSIGFNRFIMRQLNERLSQQLSLIESDRLDFPDEKVARALARLFNPVLFPCTKSDLRITQQDIGHIVGLSRQRVNQSLETLADKKLISHGYGVVKVLDLHGLMEYRETASNEDATYERHRAGKSHHG